MADNTVYFSKNPGEPNGYLSTYQKVGSPLFNQLEIDGEQWSSIEHYYQASKFKDKNYIDVIRKASEPGRARILGRQVFDMTRESRPVGFKTKEQVPIKPNWNEERITIMIKAYRAKFTQNIQLKEMLLATGDADIVLVDDEENFWKNNLPVVIKCVRTVLRGDNLRPEDFEGPGDNDDSYEDIEERPEDYDDKHEGVEAPEGFNYDEDEEKGPEDVMLPSLGGNITLRPHQQEVIEWMVKNRGLLVAHGTGTGKTLTATGAIKRLINERKIDKVVVCSPASLINNFIIGGLRKMEMITTSRKGLDDFMSIRSKRGGTVMDGGILKKGLRMMERNSLNTVFVGQAVKVTLTEEYMSEEEIPTQVYLVSHQSFVKYSKFWPVGEKVLLIVDEVHKICNFSNKGAKELKRYSDLVGKVIAMTATPYVNCLSDTMTICSFLERRVNGILRSDIVKKGRGSSQADQENYFVDKMHIFSKSPNDPDYPKERRHRIILHMEGEYLENYMAVEEEKHEGVGVPQSKAFYSGVLMAVNAIDGLVSPKINWVIDYLFNVNNKGKQVIIYAMYIEKGGANLLIDMVRREAILKNRDDISIDLIYGEVPAAERQQKVNKFNEAKTRIMVIGPAGGEGLDFKGTDSIIIFDAFWNEARLEQVIGRGVRCKSHDHLDPDRSSISYTVDVYLISLFKPEGVEYRIPSADAILWEYIDAKKVNYEIFKQTAMLNYVINRD